MEAQKQYQTVTEEIENYITNSRYPCLMAKSVFMADNYKINIYEKMGFFQSTSKLLGDLKTFISNPVSEKEFKSFIAVFPNNYFSTEEEFEVALWNQLKFLHLMDDQDWDERVNSDPGDDKFSFSLHGNAFYIIGLHPNSSRIARQAPYTALVFNLHEQFEKLRNINVFESVRNKIRQRDKQLQGNINPMLSDFGKKSEARQYSGRKVPNSWQCPFEPKKS